jgi:hypothetical protein
MATNPQRMQSHEQPTRGERWFWRLVGLTTAVGALWYYSWIWLPHAVWELPFVALMVVVIAIVFVLRWRDRRRGYAARAVRMDREMWTSTLPHSTTSSRSPDHDPPSNER